MRTCSICKEEKPLTDFAKNEYRCRPCNNERNRQYREANAEKVKETLLRYEQTDKAKARRKRYYQNGGKERAVLWQRNNPERCREASRKSYRKTFDSAKYANKNAKRRSMISGYVSEKDMRRVQSQPCAECGSTEYLSVDHIIPLSRGGKHTVGNLQSLCQPCNSSKRDKLQVEWHSKKLLTTS